MKDLTSYFKHNSSKIFWIFALSHGILWTIIPFLTDPTLPLDVIEGLTWGQEWQLGYHKHPIMYPWLLELFAIIFRRSDVAPYLLSQICVVTAFFAMWKFAEKITKPELALISVLLLEGIYYHNFTSPEFNVNVAELPFWGLTILFTWKGIKEHSIKSWILCGVFTGLGFLSKYIFLFLSIAIMVMLIFCKDFRKSLKTPGPYLAGLIALIIVTPHLIWVVQNDFITITYGINRTQTAGSSIANHFYHPVKFVVGQSVIIIPSILMLLSLKGKPDIVYEKDPSVKRFLLFITIGPVIILTAVSGMFGWKIRSMWGTPLFLSSGITLVYFFSEFLDLNKLKKFKTAFLIIFSVSLIAYGSVSVFGPSFTGRGKRIHFPGKKLVESAQSKWSSFTNQPLEIIIGPFWEAGNIAYYSKERKTVFIDADLKKSPWINVNEVKEKGAIVVGEFKEDIPRYEKELNIKMEKQEKLLVPFEYWQDIKPAEIWMSVIPPNANKELIVNE